LLGCGFFRRRNRVFGGYAHRSIISWPNVPAADQFIWLGAGVALSAAVAMLLDSGGDVPHASIQWSH